MRGISNLVVAAAGGVAVLGTPGYRPDSGTITRDGALSSLATPYNLSDSMRGGPQAVKASFWAGSFIHGLNNHRDYFVVSHVVDFSTSESPTPPIYRSSILDVTNPSSYYQRHAQPGPVNSTLYNPSTGALNASYPEFRMQALSSTDPLQGLHMTSSIEDQSYDLAFNFSSSAFLNGGLGCFWVAGGPGSQWSMPRGETSGWLDVSAGERVEVDPNHSFTWFDRQWGSLVPEFQWLMVHLPPQEGNTVTRYSILSIWFWQDAVNGAKAFATARDAATGFDEVIPVEVSTSKTETWADTNTGIVWPLQWTVGLPDGVELEARSVREDSVIPGVSDTIYTGYIDVVASKTGHPSVRGYGAVEALSSAAA